MIKIYHWHGSFPKNSNEETFLNDIAKKCPANSAVWCDSWEFDGSFIEFSEQWSGPLMRLKNNDGGYSAFVTHYLNFGQR